ncbi:sigma-54-dependent transcriptional regulator [Aneurinibacillus uraniidurans]|uniref:sigma-54-dependent transcriptional regulator n=1 Tax=Aneurinibacillus uraniidurans TaxID=2966586 RepID=UPI00234AEAB5|nr:sigma-54 dependent transcriptional regulator [Aneurinibacillus sp. B1]WCN38902.1 sigma-54 dependent transcriptional regulator [Aneurinibacillus sp. B1]
MNTAILIIDDEQAIGSSLYFAFENDYDVSATTMVSDAYTIIQTKSIDVVLLDWRLGEHDGLDVLVEIKKLSPSTEVIMMTAYGTIESSVEAIKRGAYHYITKPLDIDELQLLVEKAVEYKQLQTQIAELTETIDKIKGYAEMIGQSPAMQHVFSVIERVKDIDSSVLIFGESGTGKELVARAIHRKGKRKTKPFISINCAAIPENLLESELFGFVKGAFTGAVRDKKGKLEEAHEGTLFLDEIGEMPPNLQAKLLRVIQEKEVTPVGASYAKKLDVRIVSATNKNLLRMVQDGTFREDLYFRLNVIPLELPALRERKEDIPLLISYFLDKYSIDMQRPLRSLSDRAYERLLAYEYPGNIRQLSNIIEYAVALSKQPVIEESDLPIAVQSSPVSHSSGTTVQSHDNILTIRIGSTMKEIEQAVIEATLTYCQGNRRQTAQLLQISERNLRNKLHVYREQDE